MTGNHRWVAAQGHPPVLKANRMVPHPVDRTQKMGNHLSGESSRLTRTCRHRYVRYSCLLWSPLSLLSFWGSSQQLPIASSSHRNSRRRVLTPALLPLEPSLPLLSVWSSQPGSTYWCSSHCWVSKIGDASWELSLPSSAG